MFRSKVRAVVVPQSEHLKLAGSLAFLWGNAGFDAPPIDRLSLAGGVGQHDRGYGTLDNFQVGDMPRDEWYRITRRGFGMAWSDAAADLIVKHHLIRLASHDSSEEAESMKAEFSRIIKSLLDKNGYSPDLFSQIDRITELCDRISFDFCEEQPAENEVKVYSRNNDSRQVPIRYRINRGEIRVNPWPFSVADISGYILGYKADGYPDVLDTVILPYHLSIADFG